MYVPVYLCMYVPIYACMYLPIYVCMSLSFEHIHNHKNFGLSLLSISLLYLSTYPTENSCCRQCETRFDEFLPLLQNFKCLWEFVEGLISIWHNSNQLRQILVNYLVNLPRCKWPNIEQIIWPSGHTGYLWECVCFLLLCACVNVCSLNPWLTLLCLSIYTCLCLLLTHSIHSCFLSTYVAYATCFSVSLFLFLTPAVCVHFFVFIAAREQNPIPRIPIFQQNCHSSKFLRLYDPFRVLNFLYKRFSPRKTITVSPDPHTFFSPGPNVINKF